MNTRLILATADVRWYWSQDTSQVISVENNSPYTMKVFQLRKANTERNALRFISHRYLGTPERFL